ncbi:hypothetical protein N5C96_27425 [Delftia tsuruhatensis]|jgi:hypothetical protein|uniref:hypothetical protein n=1 Tax=Delftia TaxID=80865 RepID=UPI000647195C|nr:MULTISPECIES: hypothetical protein [Delftia]KAA9181532.1 hypothetical protein F3K36_01150 [Delftia sp. BR1]MDH0777147.1 hypothetical protein [Delftia tsuruhatensis]MDH1461167.1 hypothetical protein [Delftia tsuruhatensis]MDH1827074.1 hypothetical protein [Delftia tsuruhatensis]TDF26041.1 hypothetical protein EZI45_19455 [Delftia tsuruhatensis]
MNPAAQPISTKAEKADVISYTRLPKAQVEEGKRFAEQECRSFASFQRLMYLRGLEAYKADLARVAASS